MTEENAQTPDTETGKKTAKDSKNTLYCSFCGKSQHEVRKLIAGPTVFICDECVELCMDIIREETRSSLAIGGASELTEVWQGLRQAVPAHETLRQHFFNMANVLDQAKSLKHERQTAFRVLIAGAKGSGLPEAISDIWFKFGLPLVRFDAALLRDTRIISSADMFQMLLEQSEYNLERASNGAILIENIDRIFEPSPANRQIQEELELLMRGIMVPVQTRSSRPTGDVLQLDTSGISFFATTHKLHDDDPAISAEGDTPGFRYAQDMTKMRAALVSKGALQALADRFEDIREYRPFTADEIKSWLASPAAVLYLARLNLPEGSLTLETRDKLVQMACARGAGFDGLKSILRLIALRLSFVAPEGESPDPIDPDWLDRNI